MIEAGLVRLTETGVITHVRGEGVVWGIECADIGSHTANEVAITCVEACYRGNPTGKAIHLLGPLAGRVLRVSPPLVLPLAEAQEYLDVMYRIFKELAKRLRA